MQSYDLIVRDGDGWRHLVDFFEQGGAVDPSDATAAGWVGSQGPAIGDAWWPRGADVRLPMRHGLTLLLPEAYRVRGPELVAVSVFQGDDASADASDGPAEGASPDDPFIAQLAESREHPHLVRSRYGFGDEFALVWLTREEFERGPVDPPADVRRSPEEHPTDRAHSAWSGRSFPTTEVRLLVRDDPNAGLAPSGSEARPIAVDGALQAWARPLVGRAHLGGTAFPPSLPLETPVGAAHLGIPSIVGLVFGIGGELLVDLESGRAVRDIAVSNTELRALVDAFDEGPVEAAEQEAPVEQAASADPTDRPLPEAPDTLAFDLAFEEGDGAWVWTHGKPAEGGPDTMDGSLPGGWIGGHGPAVGDERWPRGSITGLPMLHAVTLELPEAYRRLGDGFEGVALFQGEGQFRDEDDQVRADTASDDPFLAQLADAVDDPQLRRFEDLIGGEFALVPLTREELDRGPAAPPVDVRRAGEHENDDEGPNAWDDAPSDDVVRVRLVPRDDPNAGRAPNETGAGGYEDPFDRTAWKPWAEPIGPRCHLGGTAFPSQSVPEGLTPWYLEIDEFEGLNLGGGVLQVDLESGVLDWA